MSRIIRDVHKGQSKLARYRAERLLRTGFPALRAKVLAIVRSRLRGAGVSLDRADLEACYSQAWQGLYTQVLAGERIESPEAWLVLVTFRRAIDEARAASARARPGVAEDVASDEGRAGTTDPDLAGELDDRDRLRALFEALRLHLSERECEAASLCYLQGLSRAQAAVQMGISERRMDKLMEPSGGVPGVAGKVGALLETIRSDGWCEQQSSLMRAYAFGILDPDGERHALAVVHTRECPACRAHVAGLRGLASVLPPLPLLLSLRGVRSRPRTVRRVPRRVATRPGPAAPGGWLRGGRLAAQVATCGALALGGGYALLGGRAPGGGLHHQSRGAVSTLKRTGIATGRLAANGKHRRAHARPSRHAGAVTRTSVARHLAPQAAPREELPPQEFSPERAASERHPGAGSHQSEFGIE